MHMCTDASSFALFILIFPSMGHLFRTTMHQRHWCQRRKRLLSTSDKLFL